MTRHSVNAEGYNSTTKMVFDFPKNDNNAINIQGGLRYNFTGTSSLNLTVARKTRFATIKDRYSYRLGTAIPNPDLSAERAVNYNLGYTNIINQKFSVDASVFYSDINKTIQNVNNVKFDTVTNMNLSQLQNTGRSEFYGADASVEYRISGQLMLQGNYSYIVRNNLSNRNLKFTDVPTHKVFFAAQYTLCSKLYLLGSTEYNSNRYSTSYGTISGEFMVANFKAAYRFCKSLSFEAGVNNIFDRNYTLVEGYPEEARNYLVNLIFNY